MKIAKQQSPARPTIAENKPSISAAIQPKFKAPFLEVERRRTQRVLLRTRVQIHIALAGKFTTLDGVTLSVTPKGAVVVLPESLAPNTRLVLEHGKTQEKIACEVKQNARETAEGFHTAVEFDSPSPDFWKIAFPQSNKPASVSP